MVKKKRDIISQLPPQLIKDVKARRCILFVGSGLSSMAGYPSWAELIKILVDTAKASPLARTGGIEQFKDDYFTLAEFARSALSETEYAALLRQHLGRPVKPTEAHRLIALTDYRGLITTNYDRLLETVITQERGWTPNVILPDSVSALGVALFNPELFIFKVHGDIGSSESIVLSKRDYDRLIVRSPQVRSFLQAIFLNYTVLFVGYGLRDPDFQLIANELNLIFDRYIPTQFALVPNAAEFAIEDHLKRMNVRVIPYDPADGHKEVVEVLDFLREQAPYELPASLAM
jgi:hypothetical protein